MKKWNLLLSLFLIMGTVFVTSCSKDDDETDPGPSISFKGGTGYTAEDVTIQIEEAILVGITGSTSPVSGDNLTKFKFTIISNNVPSTFVDSTFNSPSFNWESEITFSAVGEARLLFELTDKAGVKVSKELNVVVEDPGMQINKYMDVELGSWNDESGSFFSTSEGNVYVRGQLTNTPDNQKKIDFLFFKGVTNANTIAAPDDADANTIVDLQLSGWTFKNQTRFNVTNITAAQFDAIGDTYQFPVFNMGIQTSRVNSLTEGQVILFKTESNKLGLIKIIDLWNRGDKAKVSVIVQKD